MVFVAFVVFVGGLYGGWRLLTNPPGMRPNLVFFEITKPGWTSAKLVDACRERGVGIGANTATRIRAVTHLDVNRQDIDSALKVISDALAA